MKEVVSLHLASLQMENFLQEDLMVQNHSSLKVKLVVKAVREAS